MFCRKKRCTKEVYLPPIHLFQEWFPRCLNWECWQQCQGGRKHGKPVRRGEKSTGRSSSKEACPGRDPQDKGQVPALDLTDTQTSANLEHRVMGRENATFIRQLTKYSSTFLHYLILKYHSTAHFKNWNTINIEH